MRYFAPLFILLISHAAGAQTVVYTTIHYPVKATDPQTQIYLLDETQRLEQSLFPALSGDTQQAEQQARQRMQQPDWKEMESRLTGAYQSLLSAWSLGVDKVPAVVFDGRYVVYGTTDVRLAQQKWAQWQEQQR
ncbi:TIGR03757 family integrating conjugative element protein [Salmonella enterica]|nr:TIGR03757 family integrating conjugative element protein [Salmonella enterica]EAX6603688.1 TIGR03757 family integrating conjugative element protein [Salmonella enterica]